MSNNTPRRRTRVNDGYEGKVTFWKDQLELALKGEGKYPLERCHDSLKFFMGKRIDYLAKQREANREF
jgi:hypothetical protein